MFLQQIDSEQEALSHFDDEVGFMGYNGFGDDTLDFGGTNVSFNNEIASQRLFTFILNNTSTSSQKVLLFGGIAPSLPTRVAKTGNIEYVTGATNLTCSGNPQAVELFQKYVEQNPCRVLGVKVQSSSDLQLATGLKIETKTPFNVPGNRVINFSNYTSEYASNNKMATVRQEFQIDALTEIEVEIPANTQSSFVFSIGAVYSQSGALKNKAARAAQNPGVAQHRVMLAGGAPVAQLGI